jgi:hypothetical protein
MGKDVNGDKDWDPKVHDFVKDNVDPVPHARIDSAPKPDIYWNV